MPVAVGSGSAESMEKPAPLSGIAKSTISASGNAATARRRASDSCGLSKAAPKQNTTRPAEATAELNHSASSSGCATTTTVADHRTGPASARVREEGVVKAFQCFGLPVNIEAPLDERPAFRAHSAPPQGIVEQLAHPAGERPLIALRDQKSRLAIDNAFRYPAHSRTDHRYARGGGLEQRHT